MADWSTALPQELAVNGYQESFRDNCVRTSMDVGPPKVRRRATAAPQLIRGTQVLTSTQVGSLRSFYRDTLNDGSTSFNWTHPTSGSTGVEVYFAAPPVLTALGGGNFQASYEFLFKSST